MTSSTLPAPPPLDLALRWAATLPYADVLGPQLDLFWALGGDSPSTSWAAQADAVKRTGKILEELDDDTGAWTQFVDQELFPQLDALGQWASDAEEPLATELLRILFVRFGAVLQARGVASLIRVVPKKDAFDATIHRAQGSTPGPAGVVMRLLRVGYRDPRRGALVRPAEVVVGQ